MAGLIDRFRRVTTSGGYLPEIDGLRFIAIMSVLAIHTVGYWSVQAGRTYASQSAFDVAFVRLLGLGLYGVHLFFVISGFVLALPFCKATLLGGPPVNLAAYFWRRVTRLEPPYVISMLVFFFFIPLFKQDSWASLWPHLLASLGYVHNAVYGEGSLINNAAWSLEVEIQFYLLMPLIAVTLAWPQTPRRLTLAGLAAFFSLNTLWLPDNCPKSILQYAQFFLVGILVCDCWTARWKGLPRSWTADVPGLLSVPLFVWLNIRHPGVVADALNPWVMAMLFYSALRGRGWAAVLSYGAIPIIGGMCYSIYLIHGRPIALLVHGILARLPLFGSFTADYVVVFAICTAAVLLASAVFYLLVERPCMDPRWPQKLLARIYPGPSPTADRRVREVA
jgi:peptidoglycan/LPS O-acetylase OafA/YrhL